MSHPLTVLALTPSLGGDYFGNVLAGLDREMVRAGGRLVVVETLPAAAPRDEAGVPGDFSARVAWSQVDGVVSITGAVGAPYLKRLRDAGRPIVLLSSPHMESFEETVAQPDNHRGTIAAVDHLVEHGHTKIGFVGNLAQRDIRDRFAAYQRALTGRGIDVDPRLVFEAPENGETGGAFAAQGILAVMDRPTALMVATDRNAIGLMRTLTSAGIVIPRDLAIVAFDNIQAGTFSKPALSTVDQRFDEVGALAGLLILEKIRGESVSSTAFTAEPGALILRESCGCEGRAPQGRVEPSIGELAPDESKRRRLRDTLHELLQRELLTGFEPVDARVRKEIDATIDDTMQLVELGEAATAPQIHALMEALQRLTSRPDTLRRFTDAMTDFAHKTGLGDVLEAEAAPHVVARTSAALWKAQASAFLMQAELTERAIAEQYAVDAGLLDTAGSDPRELGWLAGTHVKAGILALWEDSTSHGRLEIVGAHGGPAVDLQLLGTTVDSESFPPVGLITSAQTNYQEICVVVPVSTIDRDWGLLALVAPIDTTTARETYQHWAALLSASLESQRLQEKIRRSALFDELTGLPNRHLLVQKLEQALALWKRSSTPFAVLFLDLDGFKLINDTLGHQMGDRVLQAVGADIAGQLRAVDTGARFGGDEFVILLADTDAEGARLAAQRVQETLAEPYDFDGHEIVARASIGIATSDIEYTSAEDLLNDADAAMYRAKSAEPGSVAFFDAPMHESALHRAELASEVHLALQQNQFEVHYQPIVNLTSGRTDRFEALVRWRHPDRGLLLPEDFLPAMEETGLVVEVGHWVLSEVCRQLAIWGPAVVNVSINISDKEFWSQDLLKRVLTTLHRHGLEPERLTLEIAENVLMRRPEVALRMMRKMHESGLRLHIDDFGTGYSSLETLHRFPVDAFKIDRSFIQTLTSADESAELISALVKLGKALGLSVVASGVETDEQLAFLQEIGCATGQGFLFMPAVSSDRAPDMLGRTLCVEGPDSTA